VLNVLPFILTAVLAGLGLAAARAPAQTADLPPAGWPQGLPPPGAEAFASLQALEAALDHSGGTLVA
jgi:hypothetical protein